MKKSNKAIIILVVILVINVISTLRYINSGEYIYHLSKDISINIMAFWLGAIIGKFILDKKKVKK